ncbi:MAG: hypothetical protein K8S54_10675 [Spirochaetia bacterium]|nr:hypothetical protein [Spirochaetia bacterium]
MAQADFQVKTPGGWLLRIQADAGTCEVLRGGRVEPGQGGAALHAIPEVVFVGLFESPQTQIQIFSNRKGKLSVPYRLRGHTSENHLVIPSYSEADQFPARLRLEVDTKGLVGERASPGRFAVLDESIPRIELVTLKVKNPGLNVLVLHPEEATRPPLEADHNRVRAADLVREGQGGDLVKNPVFLARIHLRNLDLPRVKGLLVDFPMTSEEMEFIRTFLQIMIRNERGQKDLDALKEQLGHLDELYRVGSIFSQGRREAFDREMDQVSSGLARDLMPLVARHRVGIPNKEDQIYFWECEFRLRKIAEKTA